MKILVIYDEDFVNTHFYEKIHDVSVFHNRIEIDTDWIRFEDIYSIKFIAESREERRKIKPLEEHVQQKVKSTPYRIRVEWSSDHLIETLWVHDWIKRRGVKIEPFWEKSVPTKIMMKFMKTPKNHMYKDMDWGAYMESDELYPCKFLGIGADCGIEFCFNKLCPYRSGSWDSSKCKSEELKAFKELFQISKSNYYYKDVAPFKELLYIKYNGKEYEP